MPHIDFNIVKEQLSKLADGGITDSSEIKHVVDFLVDIVDNVRYDYESGHNYTEGEIKQVLKQQMLGSLDELQASCDILEKKVKEILK